MTAPAPSPTAAVLESVRAWLPGAAIIVGGLSVFFALSAKVDRIELQHAEWRQKHLESVARLTAAIEREQNDTRTLMIDVARLATTSEAIREELRRQAARERRTDNSGFSPAAREVP